MRTIKTIKQALSDIGVTEVIFKKWPNGNIIALFPREFYSSDSALISSYEAIGQHGGACFDLIKQLKSASWGEYSGLETELKSLGYTLKILNRRKIK